MTDQPGILLRLVSLAVVVLLCGCGGTVGHRTRVLVVGTPQHAPGPSVASGASSAVSSAPEPTDPAVFARGACVAFPPTASNRGVTVFLDAGHGGIDPGAAGRTATGQIVYESHETLAVELDAMTILRRHGFRVVVSRTHDTSVIRLGPGDISGGILTAKGSHSDVVARDVCANDARANVLVGIYFNAGGPSNAGCLTAYDTGRPFAADNRRLAGAVQADVLAAMNAQGWRIPNDGAVSDAGLGSAVSAASLAYGHLVLLGPAKAGYHPTPSRMPGALIEPLFITDPFEGSIAASAWGQHVIAGGLAKAIDRYFASSY